MSHLASIRDGLFTQASIDATEDGGTRAIQCNQPKCMDIRASSEPRPSPVSPRVSE